jgi:hypothetical protein
MVGIPPGPKRGHVGYAPFPQWDTNISAAWELVEEMQEPGHVVTVASQAGLAYYCAVAHGDGTKIAAVYAGGSVPIAICHCYVLYRRIMAGEKIEPNTDMPPGWERFQKPR